MNRRCLKHHFHTECSGPSTYQSGFYPQRFGQDIAPFLFRSVHNVLPVDWEYPEDWNHEEEEADEAQTFENIDANGEDVHMSPQETDLANGCQQHFEQEEESERQQAAQNSSATRSKLTADQQVLQNAIRQLHRNLGHPDGQSLARAIRLTGGSDEAVRIALSFKCPVCHRLQEPKPTPAASLRQYKKFGDAVAVDLFVLADCYGEVRTFLTCWIWPAGISWSQRFPGRQQNVCCKPS